MEKDFYKERLVKKFDLDVIVPEKSDMIKINEIIFKELVFGKINSESKQLFIKIINDLITKGAQGIILGCTEIPLLIKQEDITVQIFDTTYIHAEKAVEFALKV
jgi:aspartate racemase